MRSKSPRNHSTWQQQRQQHSRLRLLLRLEVEIKDVAVLDLLFERGGDVRLQLRLRALAEGDHVVRIDVQLVRVVQLRRLEGQAHLYHRKEIIRVFFLDVGR